MGLILPEKGITSVHAAKWVFFWKFCTFYLSTRVLTFCAVQVWLAGRHGNRLFAGQCVPKSTSLLVWLIYRLSLCTRWVAPNNLQIHFMCTKLPRSLRNVITSLVFLFWPWTWSLRPSRWATWLGYVIIKANSALSKSQCGKHWSSFLIGGIFLLQKWRDCLEPCCPGDRLKFWSGLFMEATFQRKSL